MRGCNINDKLDKYIATTLIFDYSHIHIDMHIDIQIELIYIVILILF